MEHQDQDPGDDIKGETLISFSDERKGQEFENLIQELLRRHC